MPTPALWHLATAGRSAASYTTSRDTTDLDRGYVEQLLLLSPALAAARDLAQRFGALVRTHSADALTPWLADAEDGELRGFAASLRQDEQAVRAALALPWSSGQVEGQVTRLKLVKRQGYGRAKLDLLRARLIHAA